MSAASPEPLVRFIDVSKSYDGKVDAVRALNLEVEAGEFLTLLGPSGSGKTTTLTMLAGFEQPTGGRIFVAGEDVTVGAGREARHRHGVPELRAVSQHERRRKHRLPADGAPSAARRDRPEGGARAVDGAAGRPGRPPHAAALGRPAATGRRRPRPRVRAQPRPARRAAGRARPAAARADAVRAEAPAPASGRHHGLRHPRPDRGHDHVRSGRRVQHRHCCARSPSRAVSTRSRIRCSSPSSWARAMRWPPRSRAATAGSARRRCQAARRSSPRRSAPASPAARSISCCGRRRWRWARRHSACANRFPARVVEATFLGDQLRVRLAALGQEDFVVKLPNAAGQSALEPGTPVEIGWRTEDCRALVA